MSSDLEKEKGQVIVVADESDLDSLNYEEKSEVQIQAEELFHHDGTLSQSLNARLISMISLVGVIGTGLFLSSGGTLATSGPVGMIIAYTFVGTVIGANQIAITETSCLYPITSGYVNHASFFIDPALGFAMGVCDIYLNIIPNELSAVAVIMSYWSDLNPAVFITIFATVVIGINIYNVKWYGEIEFAFGILKILLVIGMVIVGLVIDLGGAPNHDRLGFRYWKDPGPFAERYATGSLGKFLGVWKSMNSAVYSFGGLQAISLLAGESQYPRRSIYRAAKRVFIRVFLLYFTMIFILSMIVSHTDPDISKADGTARGSAFVVAIKRSGIKVLPHIVNAVVLTSALSAANLQIIKASRTMFALASKRQLPKIFLRVNKHGLPYVAVMFACCFLPLCYMLSSSLSSDVFSWFQNITSSNILFNWIIISVNHIAMSRAIKAQGYSRADLPYKFKFGEFAAYYSLFFAVLFLLTGGFSTFIHGYWAFSTFFSAYFIIPLSIGLYIFAKIFWKTKIKNPKEVLLKPLFYDVQARPEPPYERLKGWQWINILWA